MTKVRRNLFNQEISPSKRSVKRGLPRSHSVSAVEGLEYKLDNVNATKGTFYCNQEKGLLGPKPVPRLTLLQKLINLICFPSLWLPSVNFPLGVAPSLDEKLILGSLSAPFLVTPADKHLFYKTS